jgi:hypothetical protein
MSKADKLKLKKHWATPTLKVYGTVEQITKQDKTLGSADGVFLLGIGPIGNAS